ncbi:hypothetical protein AJ79_02113 [Helicocarpus griseus UAMH5409]|uniref:DUF8004 domain-containing protein n=1 Tax=Helicocarpus griseus UAMH5409 TaxID=1447875 RepID=A0A2B7Y378_9EURO|nr:hypothetical protein AJ79_02113 [Helicocarpus griseus UAMH5409]
MLSVPAKSAKRISSLFSLGSSKDSADESPSPAQPSSRNSLPTPSSSSSQQKQKEDSKRQSQPSAGGPTLRHAASAQHLSTNSLSVPQSNRNVSAPLPTDSAANDNGPLVPPPSLTTVNAELSEPAKDRRQSWSGGISSMAAGLTRPGSRTTLLSADSRAAKGRSWVPGKARMTSVDMSQPPPSMRAWIAGAGQDIPYDVTPLTNGQKVDELWDDEADTLVYLFPQRAGKGPSFKVDSSIFVSSTSLTFLARGSDPTPKVKRQTIPEEMFQQHHSRSRSRSPSAPLQPCSEEDPSSRRTSAQYSVDEPPQLLHLYLPVPLDSDVSSNDCELLDSDIDMLVLFRNMFAFLIGQSLIATPRHPTIFNIFIEVAVLLNRFDFSNLDGSGFGETATSSFAAYCDELRIYDVRKSREKTLEAIVLGERMKYLPLYQEGFIHGVGRLNDIRHLNSHKFTLISELTQKRMERAFIDLDNRLRTVRSKLEDFDFPSLFSGIANSTTLNEAKLVRFKNWKAACLAYRKNVLAYYRSRFGSWPPKASSKKNQFEESGLNRLVLLELYQDFADLYDMLVDRTSLTTRTPDMTMMDTEGDASDPLDSTARALRQVMSEYDRSTPPVQPPVPFDMPLIPSMSAIRKKTEQKKESKERSKKLSTGECNEILVGSYNHTSMKPTPFLEDFTRFERRAAAGKSCDELADNRCGQWLFMYAVLQSLPMVVVDAPEVRFTQGVEYFLCVPPRGGMPWCQDIKAGRSWFGVAGGSGVVSLPSDVVANGVEGVYRRSHCWKAAMNWADQQQMLSSVMLEDAQPAQYQPSTGPPPPPLSSTGSSSDRQPTPLLTPGSHTPPLISLNARDNSPGRHPGLRPGNRASIHIGLEALPLPPSVMPLDPPPRPVNNNPGMSFDDILKDMPQKKSKK